LLLTNDCFADHSGILEHVVSGLEDALQVGGIALRQWELIAKPIESDTPGDRIPDASRFDQAIEAAGDGGWK
jgi:hypothetical protein